MMYVLTACAQSSYRQITWSNLNLLLCNVFLHIESSGSNTAALAGGIVGGIVGLLVLGGLVFGLVLVVIVKVKRSQDNDRGKSNFKCKDTTFKKIEVAEDCELKDFVQKECEVTIEKVSVFYEVREKVPNIADDQEVVLIRKVSTQGT